ncbi:hypothetical protein QFZ55_006931 [Streptomyces luteogriseus]|nr:hypothetical protein [Streptomyces luteogriseus]
MKSPAETVGLHDAIRLPPPASRSPQPATGRYVRMLGKERRSFHNPAPATTQFGYSLYEFEVRGTGGSATAAYPPLPADQPGTYRTAFFDDFTASGLDRSKRRVVHTGTEMGSVNGEAQAYVDSADTIRTENGASVLSPNWCKGCTRAGGATYDFTSWRTSATPTGRARPCTDRATRRTATWAPARCTPRAGARTSGTPTPGVDPDGDALLRRDRLVQETTRNKLESTRGE